MVTKFRFYQPTFRPNLRQTILFGPLLLMMFVIIVVGWILQGGQQFSELAQAFNHGQLNFLHPIGGLGWDPVYYNGNIYWSESPFPAVLLMPFVALFGSFHQFFYEGYIKWLFMLGILFFVYRLARILNYTKEDSLLLSLVFSLGSVFIGVASVSSSWLFAQVVTTFLLFWSFYEYYTRKRWWLIGIICALLLLTRVPAAAVILFFALEIWSTTKKNNLRLKLYTRLLVPFMVAIGLTAIYNYLRFANPFNNGSNYQLMTAGQIEARSMGIFNPVHIPTNLYTLLFRAPTQIFKQANSWTLKYPYIQSNPDGMSIFITSPYILSIFMAKWSSFDTRAHNLVIATIVSALVVLSFYGIGADQYGMRYSLDFLPGLFLLFMIIYKKHHQAISRGMKALLLITIYFNFCLVWSYIH